MQGINFFITRSDPMDPTSSLDFFPPKGSDELHEALKISYPHLHNLQARMRQAVIEFYLQEQLDQELLDQFTSPTVSDQATPPEFISFDMTPFTSGMSFPNTPALSNDNSPMAYPMSSFPSDMPSLFPEMDMSYSSSSSAPQASSPVTASPAVPTQEELTTVWALPSKPDAKIHKRRCMTAAEKAAYKQKRLDGACAECKRRRRKCQHTNKAIDLVDPLLARATSISRSSQSSSVPGLSIAPLLSTASLQSISPTTPAGLKLPTQPNTSFVDSPLRIAPTLSASPTENFSSLLDYSDYISLSSSMSSASSSRSPTASRLSMSSTISQRSSRSSTMNPQDALSAMSTSFSRHSNEHEQSSMNSILYSQDVTTAASIAPRSTNRFRDVSMNLNLSIPHVDSILPDDSSRSTNRSRLSTIPSIKTNYDTLKQSTQSTMQTTMHGHRTISDLLKAHYSSKHANKSSGLSSLQSLISTNRAQSCSTCWLLTPSACQSVGASAALYGAMNMALYMSNMSHAILSAAAQLVMASQLQSSLSQSESANRCADESIDSSLTISMRGMTIV